MVESRTILPSRRPKQHVAAPTIFINFWALQYLFKASELLMSTMINPPLAPMGPMPGLKDHVDQSAPPRRLRAAPLPVAPCANGDALSLPAPVLRPCCARTTTTRLETPRPWPGALPGTPERCTQHATAVQPRPWLEVGKMCGFPMC